ncbi:MAG: hydroxymethylbilane synthase [Flavobacteriales bacterium]|nr:hydroxymethylbilane synthase [Flavobacteriales bacterium]
MSKIIIGSRGSELALWQANHTQDRLVKLGHEVEIKIIKTSGDQIQHLSFDKMEGKSFFTKEIEEALLKKEIDLAVHSHKDLETNQPDGLTVAAVSNRENPAELLLIRKEAVDLKLPFSLKKKPIVGTSSARRKTQLLAIRGDIKLKDLRGNVPSRIQKLRDGGYDAIMLAAAGVQRLEIDLSEFHVEELACKEFIPAPAQGVLGWQIREGDTELAAIVANLNDPEVQEIIGVERKILNLFDGGCQLPLGAYCIKENGEYQVWASSSRSWDAYPQRVYFKSDSLDGLAEKVVRRLKENPAKRNVFVSRHLPENTFFRQALEENGFSVSAVALTVFEQVPFNDFEHTDWIFFSSKNCVKHFFSQNPQIGKNTKLGAVGGATDQELKLRGHRADFIGSSTDTKAIGSAFAKLVGNQSVLFPISSSSYRTVQKQFENQSNLTDLVAYHSVENTSAKVPNTDIVVLTSPSNAILYFRHHPASNDKVYIAMGNSTGKKLEEFGVANYILPWNSSVIALVDAIQSI